jgi:hypothetical protein
MMNLINARLMKNLSYTFVLITIIAVAFSCVEDDAFDVPDSSQVIIDAPDGTIDIQSIVNQYETTFAGRAPEPITFGANAGYIEGFVVSSDEGGNFFKEMVVQNKAENPTVGLNVKIDVTPLFTRFQFGRRVYIKLDGLTLGEANGVYALGLGDNLGRIQESRLDEYIIRDEETVTIVPKEIVLFKVNNDQLNQWVKVVNVQFPDSELGKTFASELGDSFDGDRFLQTCDDFFTDPIVYQTSTFSDYKALRLPDGRGTVDAIVAKDFTGTIFVLNSNSPENINFDSSIRCDFEVVSCGLASASGVNTLLDENFNGGINNRLTQPTGWTNYIEAGTVQWTTYNDRFTNSRATRASASGSRDDSTIAWLITPQFNFDAQTGEVFQFFTSTDFGDGSSLEVLFSNDWDGTPAGVTTAIWLPIADASIATNADRYQDFFSSGKVSLDCVDGMGAIAFKYVASESDGSGSSGQFNGTYELDDVKITSN